MIDTYYVVLTSIVSGFLAQSIKILILSVKNKKLNVNDLDKYGGMPSAHSAFLISLTTAIGLKDGLDSSVFALSVIVTLILIRDAIGLRAIMEKFGQILRDLINKQPKTQKINVPLKDLGGRIGHTFPEILVGGTIGFLIAFVFYHLF